SEAPRGRSAAQTQPSRRGKEPRALKRVECACVEMSPVGSKGTPSGRNGVPFEISKLPTCGILTQCSDTIVPDNIRTSCFAASAFGGDRALQKCNLSTQCARGLQVRHPRSGLPGRVLVFSGMLCKHGFNAKNLSFPVGSAAILFFFFGLGRWLFAQAIATAGDLNDFGLLEEAV